MGNLGEITPISGVMGPYLQLVLGPPCMTDFCWKMNGNCARQKKMTGSGPITALENYLSKLSILPTLWFLERPCSLHKKDVNCKNLTVDKWLITICLSFFLQSYTNLRGRYPIAILQNTEPWV